MGKMIISVGSEQFLLGKEQNSNIFLKIVLLPLKFAHSHPNSRKDPQRDLSHAGAKHNVT